MKYCDYKFYKESYSGVMSESLFNRLVIQASAYINSNTFNRIDVVNDNIKYCTCNICDIMLGIEKREGKTSESVATWHVNYTDKTEDKNSLYKILTTYLEPSLLYRGR